MKLPLLMMPRRNDDDALLGGGTMTIRSGGGDELIPMEIITGGTTIDCSRCECQRVLAHHRERKEDGDERRHVEDAEHRENYEFVDKALKMVELVLMTLGVIVISLVESSQFDYESTNAYLKAIPYTFLVPTIVFSTLTMMDYDVPNWTMLLLNGSGATLLGSCGGIALDVFIYTSRATFPLLIYAIVSFLSAVAHLLDLTNRAGTMTRLPPAYA